MGERGRTVQDERVTGRHGAARVPPGRVAAIAPLAGRVRALGLRLGRSSAIVLLVAAAASPALAADPEYRLVIKDHRFVPTEVAVPAGQKVKLVVENQDPTPEEFESYALNREKIVPGNGKIVVFVGPLKPGRYEFFGEFNAKTARGWLVVQP
jgi:hypothetical protein